MSEVWFRYDDAWTDGEPPILFEYKIKRHTNKCVVIDIYGINKYILKDAKKRFAYPTKELALDSYIIRKKRQAQYASHTYDKANANLKLAEMIGSGEIVAGQSHFQFG